MVYFNLYNPVKFTRVYHRIFGFFFWLFTRKKEGGSEIIIATTQCEINSGYINIAVYESTRERERVEWIM